MLPFLKAQKRLAASVLGCGKRKIWLDPNEATALDKAKSLSSSPTTPSKPQTTGTVSPIPLTSSPTFLKSSSSTSPVSPHSHVSTSPSSKKTGSPSMVASSRKDDQQGR
ncbi:hypothetical protein HMI56_001084 [Coelomomyces lativittatus]|nr:hypothetical protein HMI56_001084 [Coelomomyces lativittatus]